MKTIVKGRDKDLHVEPNQSGAFVNLNIFTSSRNGGCYISGVVLTEDQCGALIFGLEQALQTQNTRREGAALAADERAAVRVIAV